MIVRNHVAGNPLSLDVEQGCTKVAYPASWTVRNVRFPAVKPLPPAVLTVPATRAPSLVIQGMGLEDANSSWKTLSNLETQRSLPMKLHIASGLWSAHSSESGNYQPHTSAASVYQKADTFVNEVGEKQCAVPHAVSLGREVLVDPHIARLEGQRRVGTQFLLDLIVVHPRFYPLKPLITEGTILLTIAGPTNVIHVEAEFCWQSVSVR